MKLSQETRITNFVANHENTNEKVTVSPPDGKTWTKAEWKADWKKNHPDEVSSCGCSKKV